MIQVIMPLFDFNYSGANFIFSEQYSLQNFDSQVDIAQNIKEVFLSKQDKDFLSQQHYALVAHNSSDDYIPDINLLLIAFKIYTKSDLFIQWRFCKENIGLTSCLEGKFRPLCCNKNISNPGITSNSLEDVKAGFLFLLEMYSITDRTKNALYFIWRGLCAEKHRDAYILLVCALEALFSGETTEGVTKTITDRAYAFLSDRFSKKKIDKIYELRSEMVHGRDQHTTKKNIIQRSKNVESLGFLEDLIFICIKKVLAEKIYLKYQTVEEKESYLNTLTAENTKIGR